MKNKLEQLLNMLIKKGWKPRGMKHKIFSVQKTPDNMIYFDGGFGLERCYDFRQLTSKESGLWQFVCENDLVECDTESGWGEFSFNTDYINGFYGKHIFESNYQYRLIESSLKDESELEDFLLSNIKVEGEV